MVDRDGLARWQRFAQSTDSVAYESMSLNMFQFAARAAVS